jgi:hypothetical protein
VYPDGPAMVPAAGSEPSAPQARSMLQSFADELPGNPVVRPRPLRFMIIPLLLRVVRILLCELRSRA